jgi:uncharacterized membrane protein
MKHRSGFREVIALYDADVVSMTGIARDMRSERLLALTDGVIAVIITIMVLELKAPHGTDLHALAELWPVFSSYVLSFIYVAIYWNNHHHFFQLAPNVTGKILWANLHLLFWLSLVPFTTAWVGEHATATLPAALYGACLLACALAWYLMQTIIVGSQAARSPLRQALGKDLKGKLSPFLYVCGIASAFALPALSYCFYAIVALLWLVPDRRVSTALFSIRNDSGESR